MPGPLAQVGAAMRDGIVVAIAHRDLPVFTVAIVADELRQRLAGGAPQCEQVDGEIVVTRIGKALCQRDAGIGADGAVAIQADRHRVAGDADAELSGARTAGDHGISHAGLPGARTSETSSETYPIQRVRGISSRKSSSCRP